MFENLGKIWKEAKRLFKKPKKPPKRIKPGEYSGIHGVPACRIPGSSEEQNTGSWRVYKPVFEREKCTGCGTCWLCCPEAAIRISKGKAEVNYNICKGCLICVNECPYKAIEAVRDEHEK